MNYQTKHPVWWKLVWWKHNIKNSFQYLLIPKPDIAIFTDVSETGWGITDGHNPSGGQWLQHERMHINVLQLKAAFIGIRTYCHHRSYKYIGVMSDTSTAVAYINNKGGINSQKCIEIAKRIWLWCFKNNSFISAVHIPGKHNIEADRFSRKFSNNTEWQLNLKIFIEITKKFCYTEIGLVVTRMKTQLQNYGAWFCEPDAKAVGTFLTDWGKQLYYIFPSNSLLGKITSKTWQDKAHCIVIIPKWITQYWYPLILEMAISEITIKPAPNNFLLPQDKNKLYP